MTTTNARPAPVLTDLGAVAQLRAGRLGRRVPQLLVGLVLYGASLGMMVRGALGVSPWDVMHLGFIEHVSVSLGQAVILFSAVVLALWVPLREKPGVGTIANAIIVGLAADATLALIGPTDAWAARIALTVGGVAINGLAGALYIGAQLGRGPRDGLMTGLARRTGLSLRLVRTAIEVSVIVIGLLLAGSVVDGGLGLGTVLYALAIGPLTQAMLPWFLVRL